MKNDARLNPVDKHVLHHPAVELSDCLESMNWYSVTATLQFQPQIYISVF